MNKETTENIIEQYIETAERDEPVWIGEVREAFNAQEDSRKLTLKLALSDNTEREFPCHIPVWKTAREKEFCAEYLCAFVYNALSALGGKKREYVFDPAEEELRSVIADAEKKLSSPSGGYQRILRETARISRLTEDCAPAERKNSGRNVPLDEILRTAAEKALQGVRAGIDVGGTDIKFAVSVDGHLTDTLEYDWNPGSFPTAARIIEPILSLTEKLLRKTGAEAFDGIGLSFPDVVMADRICGGETPKTEGIRSNPEADYETEFGEISALGQKMKKLCKPDAAVRLANDGSVAAITSAVELSFSSEPELIASGAFSHALGTSLGTGLVMRDGRIPAIPLEFYDSVIDLGSLRKRGYDTEDIRSTRSSSGVPGVDRYLGQASAFRYAYERNPALLDGFTERTETGILRIRTSPADLRKPCLEHLMKEAENGDPDAEWVFTRIGESFGRISREAVTFLSPEPDTRFIFGRFAKYPGAFRCIRNGFEAVLPEVKLIPADDSMAYSPLMLDLAARKEITVAQFGQAIGAIYLSGTDAE